MGCPTLVEADTELLQGNGRKVVNVDSTRTQLFLGVFGNQSAEEIRPSRQLLVGKVEELGHFLVVGQTGSFLSQLVKELVHEGFGCAGVRRTALGPKELTSDER